MIKYLKALVFYYCFVRYLCGVFTKTSGNKQKIPQRTEWVKTLSGLGLLDFERNCGSYEKS